MIKSIHIKKTKKQKKKKKSVSTSSYFSKFALANKHPGQTTWLLIDKIIYLANLLILSVQNKESRNK